MQQFYYIKGQYLCVPAFGVLYPFIPYAAKRSRLQRSEVSVEFETVFEIGLYEFFVGVVS